MNSFSKSRRRSFVAGLGASALASCRGACSSNGDGSSAHKRDAPGPNVVLLTADDLGIGSLGCDGNGDARTPHIDRLAAEGVRFARAFNVTSTCSVSRASLATGQYPHTHGILGLTHRKKHRKHIYAPDYPTLPVTLAAAGYATALQGKWHIAPNRSVTEYGYTDKLNEGDSYAERFDTAKAAVDFIERNRSRAFYLEINYLNTHRKPNGSFPMVDGFRFEGSKVSVPASWSLPDIPEIREEMAGYHSQLSFMDKLIGDVLGALDRLQLVNDTIIAFISDNGAPFPGNKLTLYDRGIATPLIVRWPGRAQANRVCEHLVSSIDVMPTLLTAAGIDPPAGVQGRSFLPLLENVEAPATQDAVFAEMHYHSDYHPTRAVRTQRWKYIVNLDTTPTGLNGARSQAWAKRLAAEPDNPWTKPRPPAELYDLGADANEQKNLVDEADPEVLADLRRRLHEHMTATKDEAVGQLPA